MGGKIEFKFTLGTWERVETSAPGGDVPNRVLVIPDSGPCTYSATMEAWRNGSAPEAWRSTASESVSVLSDSFPLSELGRTRRMWIYLPPDYARSRRRYSVLYMQDGQNVFDAATSFVGERGVDETLDSLHAAGDPGIIVVAAPRYYFASGLNETVPGVGPGVFAGAQREMVDALRSAGLDTRRDVRSLLPADGEHTEWFWRREFAAAYLWAFGRSAERCREPARGPPCRPQP